MTAPIDGTGPAGGLGPGIAEIIGVGVTVDDPTGPTTTLTATAASVAALALAGGTMSGDIAMGGNNITGAELAILPDLTIGQRQTPLGVTSSTPVPYLTVTSGSLAGGLYLVLALIQMSSSAAQTDLNVFFEINGAPVGTSLLETGVAGGSLPIGSTSAFVLPAGVSTFEMLIANPGSGTATAVFGSVVAFKIAP